MRTWQSIVVAASIALIWGHARGQVADMTSLTRVQAGKSHRVSSAAPTPGSNRDNRRVAPGETLTLAEIDGPATINHIWLTFNEARPNWISADGSANPSEIVLRMYWDGAAEPAVEAPLGDFFGAGFGLRREIKSVPMQVESGDGYNCFWQMPFFKHAKITVTNEGDKNLNSLYYHIDYCESPDLPKETAYFCAQYRQEVPQQLGHDYLVCDIQGQGHYVGTVISARSRSPEWFGEGDDKFYIDGDAADKPSLWGTGTEDYFLCAWGMNECSFPYFGCTYLEGDESGFTGLGVRYTMYRWHIVDPIRFTKSLRFEIEHKGWISSDETESGKTEGHVEREDDIASVAFWYQVGQPKRFSTMPGAKQRVFPNLDLVIEGNALLANARATPGDNVLQSGYDWTGAGQMFYKPAAGNDAFLEFDFEAPGDGKRRAPVLRLTRSYDYGIWRILLDGNQMGEPIDLYSKDIVVHDLVLDTHAIAPGRHTLRLECVGRNPLSRGSCIGVDSVRLRERWDRKRPALKP